MKKTVYFTSAFLLLLLGFLWGELGLASNTQGGSCYTLLWENGEVIKTVDFNAFFQWLWNKKPCRFSAKFLFGFYLLMVPAYLALKTYGAKYFLSSTCSQFIAMEMLIYFVVYYLYLMNKVIAQHLILSYLTFIKALLGGLLFFSPFIVLAVLISWATSVKK